MIQLGIPVRYQDGGTGTVYGKARFSLPNDEKTMLALHKAFRSNAGVASKLIKTVTEEGMNLTAGLMSSEAAYTEKRSIFTQWANEQIASGKYQTELKQIIRGEGDGEYKRLVMEADGALAQKLMTYEAVMNRFAQAIEKQKWVPEIQMGASSGNSAGEGGSNAMALIDMLSVKTAKDLALDMSLPTND